MAKRKQPSERTLQALRKEGVTADKVERFNAHAGPFGQRFDLFGIIDIIALRGGRIVGIQATSSSNHSSHIKKAQDEPRLREWLACGGLFEVWSWGKKVLPGTSQVRWKARIEALTLPKQPELFEQPEETERRKLKPTVQDVEL